MAEYDSVSETYYDPVRRSNCVGAALFWFGIVLSVCSLYAGDLEVLLQGWTAVKVGDVVGPAFLVVSVFLFLQGIAHRLYFYCRAEDARRQHLLSNAFGEPISSDESIGYYNNPQTEPFARLAANCMESAFFTKEIARGMLSSARIITVSYVILYYGLVLYRDTDFGWIEIGASVIFSEEVISRWLRLEFLRSRSEKVFDKFYNLFSWSQKERPKYWNAEAISGFAIYEASKVAAAITLSSKRFKKVNPKLSVEWDRLCVKLGIAT